MHNSSTTHRLQTAKTIILGLVAAVAGIAFIVLSRIIPKTMTGSWEWVTWIPFQEVGGTLFTIGLVGVAYDLYTKRDEETAAVERLRATLKSEAPVMRDAVIEGFAFNAEDLKRVGTPELLDQLAENALALRFGDTQFAAEVYGDIRDQAIAAKERWHDVRLRVRLSTAVERNTNGIPLFDVTCTWEYTTTPSTPHRRFVCVSDRQEYRELASSAPETLGWFMMPRDDLGAGDREAFELTDFQIGDVNLLIRRHGRKDSQAYVVKLPDQPGPQRLSYTYRTVTAQRGGMLFFAVPVPARSFAVEVDYSDCPVERMSVVDLVPSSRRASVRRSHGSTTVQSVSVHHDGWLLAGGGFGFNWVLTPEASIRAAQKAPSPTGRTAKQRNGDTSNRAA